MSTGAQCRKLALAVSLAILCAGAWIPANAAQSSTPRRVRREKAKKTSEPAPLPSGPTGPVQPMPLDAIAAVPPQVTFENNQLTINAPNSTMADILRAVRKSTGAEIDVPAAPERVVTHLGPGPARDVLADLLNGSRFNYVLLGAPGNDSALTRVVLVAKTEGATPNPPAPAPQPGMAQAATPPVPEDATPPDVNDPAMNGDDNNNNAMDDNAEPQPAPEGEQQSVNPDQPQVKTPQQMLQEMQQRQMQLQMQQGQPPQGSGMPPHPPPQDR